MDEKSNFKIESSVFGRSINDEWLNVSTIALYSNNLSNHYSDYHINSIYFEIQKMLEDVVMKEEILRSIKNFIYNGRGNIIVYEQLLPYF